MNFDEFVKMIIKVCYVERKKMLEWLLTESNLLHAIIIISLGSIILFTVILNKIPSKYSDKEYDKKGKYIIIPCISCIFIVPLLTIIVGIYFHSKITTKYVSNSEWKEMYTNQIDADVTLHIKYCRACKSLDLKGGDLIGDNHISYTDYTFGKIDVQKNDLTETRSISIDKNDIIYNNELTSTSKLTKVEYKPVTGMYKEAFGHCGKIEKSDKDGMVRITISDDKNKEREELKSLFSN